MGRDRSIFHLFYFRKIQLPLWFVCLELKETLFHYLQIVLSIPSDFLDHLNFKTKISRYLPSLFVYQIRNIVHKQGRRFRTKSRMLVQSVYIRCFLLYVILKKAFDLSLKWQETRTPKSFSLFTLLRLFDNEFQYPR